MIRSNPLTKPISNHAFKYTPRRYAKGMIERGSVRIRPLQFYTEEETLGRFIGDKNEGVTTSSMYFDRVSTMDRLSQPEQAFLRDHGHVIEHSVGTYIGRARRRSEPLYMYCVSDHFDRSLAEEFCKDEEPGIVWIPNLHEFYWAISECISEFAEPFGYAKVVYVAGELDYHIYGSVSPALVKDEIYRSQSEVRMVWRPKGDLREHLDCSSARIAAACCDGDFAICR